MGKNNKNLPTYVNVVNKGPTGKQIVRHTAMVEVNFDHQLATVTMKDAKVTFPDKVGNIGGTFGVFLGLSFVGILDILILMFNWFKNTKGRKFMY